MTPTTLIIDRSFRGVGRVKKATGTTDPRVRRKMNRMLDDLADQGRLDLLRALRDGELTLMELHDAYQRRALDALPLGPIARPLPKTMQSWIDGLRVPDDVSAKHKDSLTVSRRYLEREDAKATVADLPRVVEALRDTLGAKHPRSFNLVRSAALAFVRATLKRSHPLWLAVAAVEPRKVKASKRRTPLALKQLAGFFPAPESDPVDAVAWGMAFTGMGPSEYWGAWHVRADRIHIEGTKRAGRVRDVPLVRAPAAPRLSRDLFRKKVNERTAAAISPYDLRRTFANWMEAAGVPRTRRRLYLGHGAGDVTGLYELHEVTAFLAEDALKLRSYLGLSEPAHTKTHTMTLEKRGGA
jgi:integrase